MPVYNVNIEHLKKIVEASNEALITVYTLQHREAIKQAVKTGFLSGLKADEDFGEAYCWMREQMNYRIRNFSGEWPVWCHLGVVQPTLKLVRIKARIPRNRILLSNYRQWEDVMNLWPVTNGYGNKYRKLDKLIPLGGFACVKDVPKEIQATWQRIFDIEYKKSKYYEPSQVQACVDRIYTSDIVEVTAKYSGETLKNLV